jgi:hypothetical protein
LIIGNSRARIPIKSELKGNADVKPHYTFM